MHRQPRVIVPIFARTAIGLVLIGAFPSVVSAHGPAPAEPPDGATLLLGWTFEPLPTLGIVAASLWWWWAVRRVNARHPSNPVPRWRSAAFGGGMVAVAFALISGIERYDTTLFSVHMVQHILLTLVAAPLIALSGPITLLLRVSSAGVRRRWILPALHARLTRVLAFPIVAWLAFAAVMWVSHFSPVFDAALEEPLIHELEHMAYLAAALLFWWPAVAQDPAAWRMPHPVRALYVFLQMSQNTFLAVVLLNAQTVLYPHYATIQRAWGPTAIEDQRLAGGLMWIVGDLIFLMAIMAILIGWARADTRATARADRRAAEELAEIRIREALLAERLAAEREAAEHRPATPRAEPTDRRRETQPGSGASR